MKKQKSYQWLLVCLFIILIGTVCGCGLTHFKGTYVNEVDSKKTLKFSGESKVVYRDSEGSKKGSYVADDGMVIVEFEDDGSWMFLDYKEKKVLYEGTTAYVKKNFFQRHWVEILIASIIFSIVSAVYKKKTGRSLEDDFENFVDNLES